MNFWLQVSFAEDVVIFTLAAIVAFRLWTFSLVKWLRPLAVALFFLGCKGLVSSFLLAHTQAGFAAAGKLALGLLLGIKGAICVSLAVALAAIFGLIWTDATSSGSSGDNR